MARPLNRNSGYVKGRLQAALYYMRKKNRERRDLAPVAPPEPKPDGN